MQRLLLAICTICAFISVSWALGVTADSETFDNLGLATLTLDADLGNGPFSVIIKKDATACSTTQADYTDKNNADTTSTTLNLKAALNADNINGGDEFAICFWDTDGGSEARYPAGSAMLTRPAVLTPLSFTFDHDTLTLQVDFTGKLYHSKDITLEVSSALILENNTWGEKTNFVLGTIETPQEGATDFSTVTSPAKFTVPFHIPNGDYTVKYDGNAIPDLTMLVFSGLIYDHSVAKDSGLFSLVEREYVVEAGEVISFVETPVPQLVDKVFENTNGQAVKYTCNVSAITDGICTFSVVGSYDSDIFSVSFDNSTDNGVATIAAAAGNVITNMPQLAVTIVNDGAATDDSVFNFYEDISFTINATTLTNDLMGTFNIKGYVSSASLGTPKILGEFDVGTRGNGAQGYISIPFASGVTFSDLKLSTDDTSANASEQITLEPATFTFPEEDKEDATKNANKLVKVKVTGTTAETLTHLIATVTCPDNVHCPEFNGRLKAIGGGNADIEIGNTSTTAPTIRDDVTITLPDTDPIDLSSYVVTFGGEVLNVAGTGTWKAYYGTSLENALRLSNPVTFDKADGEATYSNSMSLGTHMFCVVFHHATDGPIDIACKEGPEVTASAITTTAAVIDTTNPDDSTITLTLTNESKAAVPTTFYINNMKDDENMAIVGYSGSLVEAKLDLQSMPCFKCTFGYNGAALSLKDGSDQAVAEYHKLPEAPEFGGFIPSKIDGNSVEGYVVFKMSGAKQPLGNGTETDMSDETFVTMMGNNLLVGIKPASTGCTSKTDLKVASMTRLDFINGTAPAAAFTATKGTLYSVCYCYGDEKCGEMGRYIYNTPIDVTYPAYASSTDPVAPSTTLQVAFDADVPTNTIVYGYVAAVADKANCDASKLKPLSLSGDTVSFDMFGLADGTTYRLCYRMGKSGSVELSGDDVGYTAFGGSWALDGSGLLKLTKTGADGTSFVGPFTLKFPAGTSALQAAAPMVALAGDKTFDAVDSGDGLNITGIDMTANGYTMTISDNTKLIIPNGGVIQVIVPASGNLDVSRHFAHEGKTLTQSIMDLMKIIPEITVPDAPSDNKTYALVDGSPLTGIRKDQNKVENVPIPMIDTGAVDDLKAAVGITDNTKITITRTCNAPVGHTCTLTEFNSGVDNGAITLAAVACAGSSCTWTYDQTEKQLAVKLLKAGNPVVITGELNVGLTTSVTDGDTNFPDDTVLSSTNLLLLPEEFSVNLSAVGDNVMEDTPTLVEVDLEITLVRPISAGKNVVLSNFAATGASVTFDPATVTFDSSNMSKVVKIKHNKDTEIETITAITFDDSSEDPYYKGFTASINLLNHITLAAVAKDPVTPTGPGGETPEEGGMSTLAIVGISVGVLIVIGVVVALIVMKGGKGKAKTSKVQPMSKKSVKDSESVEFADES